MPDVTVACLASNRLGEGPMWHQAERALYWIDGLAPALHRIDACGRHSLWPMPEPVGSFVFRRRQGLVGAFKSGFSTIDLEATSFEAIVDPEPDRPSNMLNDGKCDRRGRYWCGSRAGDLVSAVGSLFRLDADRQCRRMDDGFAVSNGIAWSPDDKTMYFADSPTGSIFAYDFDLNDGEIGNRRLFASTREIGGLPDGATVDAEGCYWSALFGGAAVARFDPQGRLITTVRMPVKNPTMCTFGGDRLDVLYVTSARALMSDAELASQPLAGALFAITGLGVTGISETLFAG